jgi:hypothetical protein
MRKLFSDKGNAERGVLTSTGRRGMVVKTRSTQIV